MICFLLQSYFWVPTYEEQSRGNPDRLNEYISASIGDASILNPILASDSASSDINGLVFEGLLDRDENLRFRGRLATSWEIYEEAFFYVNEEASIPSIGMARPGEIIELLKNAKRGSLPANTQTKISLENIQEITLLPARDFVATREEKGGKEPGQAKEITIRVKV